MAARMPIPRRSTAFPLRLSQLRSCPTTSPVRPSFHQSGQRLGNAAVKPQRFTSTKSTPFENVRRFYLEARRDHPVLLPILFVACIASVSVLGLLLYDDNVKAKAQYSAYPAPVEQQLRLGLHFTHISEDPDKATHYFAQALEAAEKCGMDPFSKEVVGIRSRLAEMLEKFGRVKGATEVLAGMVKDYEDKLSELDQGTMAHADTVHSAEANTEGPPSRGALIKGIIQFRAKMASLYSSDYIQDERKAKEVLSDAIGLLVRETKDPQSGGFSDDNNAGISMGEIADLLAQMGFLYTRTGEESNAIQVYMLALDPLRKSCNGASSCREVELFGSIAAAMGAALRKPGAKINGRPPTAASTRAAWKAALAWTDQAIATAGKVEQDRRDEVCEQALFAAQMTRAALLLELGEKAKSKEAYQALIPSLRARGMEQVLKSVEEQIIRAA